MEVRRRVGCLVAFVLLAAASRARADDPVTTAAAPPATAKTSEPPPGVEKAAPWLNPWLPPRAPDLDPQLADGDELSLEAATGMAVSSFTTAAALGETVAYGRYLVSSTKQALSIEGVEKLQLALDHVTPQVGMVGAGLRRIGRRNVGGLRTLDFERLTVGPGFASRGSNLDVGLAAGFAFGAFGFSGSGVSISLDTYFLKPSDLTGSERLLMLTVGYIFCPRTGAHIGPPHVAIEAPPPPPPAHRPCPDMAAYQEMLIEQRRIAVDVCNKGPSEECLRRRDFVTALSAKAGACSAGENVGPPTVDNDL